MLWCGGARRLFLDLRERDKPQKRRYINCDAPLIGTILYQSATHSVEFLFEEPGSESPSHDRSRLTISGLSMATKGCRKSTKCNLAIAFSGFALTRRTIKQMSEQQPVKISLMLYDYDILLSKQ